MTRKRLYGESLLDDLIYGPEPAFSVVVYRNPGPDESKIVEHSQQMLQAYSPWGRDGALAYLTLVESDFDRLWDGVDRGDAYGTAYSVLRCLGPGGRQFIGREDDFTFGWIGDEDSEYGRVLLLQVFPRPHLLGTFN